MGQCLISGLGGSPHLLDLEARALHIIQWPHWSFLIIGLCARPNQITWGNFFKCGCPGPTQDQVNKKPWMIRSGHLCLFVCFKKKPPWGGSQVQQCWGATISLSLGRPVPSRPEPAAAPNHRGREGSLRPAYSTSNSHRAVFTGFLGLWEAASSGLPALARALEQKTLSPGRPPVALRLPPARKTVAF